MNRPMVGVVVAALAVGGLGGCGKPVTTADKVRAAVERTRRQSRRFVYSTESSGRKVAVQGFVEDDLRFQSTVSIGGTVVLDEIVRDDAVADHFRDPSAVPLFLRPAPTGSPAAPGGTGGQPGQPTPAPTPALSGGGAGGGDHAVVMTALGTGRWVLDAHGAPTLVPARPGAANGFDPALEAIQVFEYTEAAIRQAESVVKFNAEDVSYKPKEDPFPRPEAGVIRYDLRPAPLPRPGTGGSVNQAVPDVRNFRKMSIYVKAGIVQAVRETIDVKSRLNDFVRLYGAKLPRTATLDQQAQFAIDVTNSIRKGQGQEPIAIRTMSATFSDIGGPLSVVLPADTVSGDLSLLADLGPRIRTSLG